MSEKPVIFISHATTDNPIVDILKSQIEHVFANGVQVFASSVPGVIKPGRLWLDEIKNSLDVARAVIVVITPVSINRPWIWFEVGASWSKMETGNRRIYPLCVPEIDFNELPAPLSSLQALSLGKAKDVKLFFQELCNEFGFGNLKGFKTTTITSSLPKYAELVVRSEDLKSGTIYTGPYEKYSEEELSEVIRDYLVDELNKIKISHPLVTDYSSDISESKLLDQMNSILGLHTGKLLHYEMMDEKLNLPPGTSEKLLKESALKAPFQIKLLGHYGEVNFFRIDLLVDKEFPNCVKFRYKLHPQKNIVKRR